MSRQIKEIYGNGKVHPYPLERLLIFTEKLFESLKKEIFEFKLNEPRPEIANVKHVPKVKNKPLPERITHEYIPSNISHAYDGDYWRWQRVSEWFKEYAHNYE